MTDFNHIIKDIEKNFGARSLWMGNAAPDQRTDAISTGSRKLDRATGIGGIPQGRIVEIFGPEGSGKSTLSIQIMAQAQRMGINTAYIDAEHTFDAYYAAQCGLDLDLLLVSQPDSAEIGLGITERLAKSGEIGLIVIDTVAALVPEDEIAKDMSETTVALQARLMSRALRKITPLASNSNTAVVFLNQIRDKISSFSVGDATVTPGGRALKFYSSMRIELRAGKQIKDRDVVIGNHVHARVRKNKLAPPFRQANVSIIYGEGFSNEIDIINDAVDAGVITKRGSHFHYDGSSIGMGQERTRQELKSNPGLTENILADLEADT